MKVFFLFGENLDVLLPFRQRLHTVEFLKMAQRPAWVFPRLNVRENQKR